MKPTTIHLGGRLYCPPQDLELLKADVNYTVIYFKNGTKKIVATTIGEILKRLETFPFSRVNRSFVVNLDSVLVNKTTDLVYNHVIGEIYISKRRKRDFYKKLIDQALKYKETL